MNKNQALNFLRRYQPLPPDDALTEELIAEYDQVRNFFLVEPDSECIPLFLNSFGEGDGLGVY